MGTTKRRKAKSEKPAPFPDAPASAKTTRCTGHCCRDFTLPYSPEELKARYLTWATGEEAQVQMNGPRVPKQGTPQGIHLIYPMVRHLGQYDSPPTAFVVPPEPAVPDYKGRTPPTPHHYTCVHYDAQTHNCSIYDIRPPMCRDYPYGNKCNYNGCTWKEQKQPPLTREEKTARRERDKARARGLRVLGKDELISGLSELTETVAQAKGE